MDVCSSLVWSLLEYGVELEMECASDDVRVCVFEQVGCVCLGVCHVECVRRLCNVPQHFLKMETIVDDQKFIRMMESEV